MDNYTGKRLDGRYEIQEVIGVGGMAVVYKAYDNIDDRTVAVKILKEEYLANEEFRRRFKNESKAIAVLSHPNIVKVYNVSYGDRLQYIVMEYVEGITLKEYIEQQGRLGIKETVHFTMQILRALQHAHDKGIVHRDIKPQNILLLSNGNIKVTDFGIARFSYSDTKTMTDSAIGSVHYISPEQARGDTTDDRADIYSVGVVLYEMLTGQLPFQSDNSVSVALMQLQTDPKRPRELNSSIPVGLEQIVMHAMQKNVKDRYLTAAEMLLDIEEFKRNPTIRFQRDYFVDNDPTKFVPKRATAVSSVNQAAPVHTPATQPEYLEYEDEEDDERSGKGGLVAIGVTIGLLVLGLFVFIFLYFFTDAFQPDMLEVPNFFGKNYETEIKGTDYEKDFDFVIENVSNSSYEDGAVFFQVPASGQKIKPENNVITLSVADNAQELVVPDVYGYQHELAKETLESKGFKVQSLPILNLVQPFGTVIKTEPAANSEVTSDTTITIYFASDEDLIQVPDNAVGWDVEMAKAIIESVGLTVDEVIIYENSSEENGTVIRTEPEAGEKVIQGSKVKLVASNGIPEVGTATLTINLPSSGSTRGNFEVFVNNESFVTKTLLMDGKEYSTDIQGSGENASVKVYIDDKEYYTCTVDFTKNPAVVSNASYSSGSSLGTRKAMPSVTGLSYETAVAQLNAQGFYNIVKKADYSAASNQTNIVTKQDPAASSQGILGVTNTYSTDTQITLYVGSEF